MPKFKQSPAAAVNTPSIEFFKTDGTKVKTKSAPVSTNAADFIKSLLAQGGSLLTETNYSASRSALLQAIVMKGQVRGNVKCVDEFQNFERYDIIVVKKKQVYIYFHSEGKYLVGHTAAKKYVGFSFKGLCDVLRVASGHTDETENVYFNFQKQAEGVYLFKYSHSVETKKHVRTV